MVKVKICGITNKADASMAVDCGADALGFIFSSSPRQIRPETAREIIKNLPPFVSPVGVFVDENYKTLRGIMDFCGIVNVQLHGDETPEFCERLMPGSIKAFRIKDSSTIKSIKSYKGRCNAILLDAYSKDRKGGTGLSFDWGLAVKAKEIGIPVILAGGLGPSNIHEAISIVKPYAVDVNSGIEESPGKKSRFLMEELFDVLIRIGDRSQIIKPLQVNSGVQV